MIYEITEIANDAFRGNLLLEFSIRERKCWAEHYNTSIEEDGVYCLIGIFDVSMALNYGEGRGKAFGLLQHASNDTRQVHKTCHQSSICILCRRRWSDLNH